METPVQTIEFDDYKNASTNNSSKDDIKKNDGSNNK